MMALRKNVILRSPQSGRLEGRTASIQFGNCTLRCHRVWHGLLCALLLALVPAVVTAHVTATGLAVVTVDDSTVTYRLTVVPAELPEPAAQLLARAAAGDRSQAERLAEAVRHAVTLRVN